MTAVWQRLTEQERQEAVRFWLAHNALPDVDQAWRRTAQLVTMVRSPTGSLVGVSTVYPDGLGPRRVPHYFYRMFISPPHRRAMLMIQVLDFTLNVLQRCTPKDGTMPAGLVIVTENRKLMRPGMRRLLSRHGYRLLGQDDSGQDVWRAGFSTDSPA